MFIIFISTLLFFLFAYNKFKKEEAKYHLYKYFRRVSFRSPKLIIFLSPLNLSWNEVKILPNKKNTSKGMSDSPAKYSWVRSLFSLACWLGALCNQNLLLYLSIPKHRITGYFVLCVRLLWMKGKEKGRFHNCVREAQTSSIFSFSVF